MPPIAASPQGQVAGTCEGRLSIPPETIAEQIRRALEHESALQCADRMLATRLSEAAVERLLSGAHGVLVGLINNAIAATPLDVVVASKKPLDTALLDLARVLAK